jgi:hypothetical protein
MHPGVMDGITIERTRQEAGMIPSRNHSAGSVRDSQC